MMVEGIRVVLAALARHQGVQLVEHEENQVELVSWVSQMDEQVQPQQLLSHLQSRFNSSV